jgi:hypothetical protein
MSRGSGMGIATPDMVSDFMQAERSAVEAAKYQQKPELDSLASHVMRGYEAAKMYRAEEIDDILLEDLRQISGEYDPQKLKDIAAAGQPAVFMNLTGEKCRGADGWLGEVQNYDNDKSFTLLPTPLPDLPDDAEQMIAAQVDADMQALMAQGQDVSPGFALRYASDMRDEIDSDLLKEAKDRASRMDTLVFDQMIEGDYRTAIKTFRHNVIWSPVGYIKGPVFRRVPVLRYSKNPFGATQARIEKVIKPTFEAPSPFDIYPSRGAVEVDDGELYERIRLAPSKLEGMKGVPGWNGEAIDAILAKYDSAGGTGAQAGGEVITTDSERQRLEHKGTQPDLRDLIEGVEYWGSVTGRMLKEKGVMSDNEGKPLADLGMYESNVILLGGLVVYSALNPDMLGKRPYAKTSWYKKPGSWFGSGVPRLMREVQQVVNATVRSLCFNMAQASGFQTILNDITRIPNGEVVTEAFAGKMWQFLKPNPGDQTKPIEFWQPNPMAETLLNVYKHFKSEAETITGIPAYSYGNDQSGNSSRTLGGLNILMSNSARGIKMVLSNIDQDVTRRIVEKLFTFNMIYSDREDIKGDVTIQCAGALAMILNEQNAQKIMQILQSSANPMDEQVIGPEERGVMYRELVKATGLQKNSAVKTDDVIRDEVNARRQQEQQMAMAQEAGQGDGSQAMTA